MIAVLDHTKILEKSCFEELSNSFINCRVANFADVFDGDHSFVVGVCAAHAYQFTLALVYVYLFVVGLQSIFSVLHEEVAFLEFSDGGLPFVHLLSLQQFFRCDKRRWWLSINTNVKLLILIIDIRVEFACVCSRSIIAIADIGEDDNIIELFFLRLRMSALNRIQINVLIVLDIVAVEGVFTLEKVVL